MDVIEALKQGKIRSQGQQIPRHIIMAVSNVFVFDDKVYKIYRNDNEFFNANFNNLSDKENRFVFTRRDYEWNHRLSPEIYTGLLGATAIDGEVILAEPTDAATELIIEMNKVDMSNQLLKKLFDGRISLNDCYEIGRQFGEREKLLPRVDPTRTVYEDFMSRYVDIVNWVGGAEKHIPKDEVVRHIEFLRRSIESRKEVFGSKRDMGTCIDIHADNGIYKDGTYLPLDIYAARDAWLQGYRFINIYRLATDMYVFAGREHFEEALRGYQDSTGTSVPREHDPLMLVYCALLTWPYHYYLSEKEPWRIDVAKKVQRFIEMLERGRMPA